MTAQSRRFPPRMCTVRAIDTISPSVRRIVLEGARGTADLAEFGAWPAAYAYLFFPQTDQREPVLPTCTAAGRPLWPAPSERPAVRTYSVRQYDRAADTIAIDFVLHEGTGPGVRWATHVATCGTRVGVAGPGGSASPLVRDAWTLYAGDLSALPAIAAHVEALPREARGIVALSVPTLSDRQRIAAPPGVQLYWLACEGRSRACSALLEFVEHARLPADAQAWLAGEQDEIAALAQHLRGARGMPEARLYAMPYWRRDKEVDGRSVEHRAAE